MKHNHVMQNTMAIAGVVSNANNGNQNTKKYIYTFSGIGKFFTQVFHSIEGMGKKQQTNRGPHFTPKGLWPQHPSRGRQHKLGGNHTFSINSSSRSSERPMCRIQPTIPLYSNISHPEVTLLSATPQGTLSLRSRGAVVSYVEAM